MVDHSNDTRTSGHDYLTITRDGKHFATILNLMRYQDLLYVHGYTLKDLKELIEELSYYRLDELLALVISMLGIKGDREITTIYSNHQQCLRDISRPTMVISGEAIRRATYFGIDIPHFLNLFRNGSFDLLVFENSNLFNHNTEPIGIFLYLSSARKSSAECSEPFPDVAYVYTNPYNLQKDRFIEECCIGIAAIYMWLQNPEKGVAACKKLKFGDELKKFLPRK
jgi:hypothetical protein